MLIRALLYLPSYKGALELVKQFKREGLKLDNAVSRAARTADVNSHILLTIAKQQRLDK